MSKYFGLDFGTTNSSISIEEEGVGTVLEIDSVALDPRVVRSMLYILPRKITFREGIPPSRIQMQIFEVGDIIYQGELVSLFGQNAIERYLSDNKNRSEGVRRKIYTGKWWKSGDRGMEPAEPNSADAVREYYEEVDYGTGRLMQALKTALKSSFYRGTTVFGEFYTLEDLISFFIKKIKEEAEKKLGEQINEVVCGRPVHFLDNPERDKVVEERLEKSLKLAGFEKIIFEYEPVAAAKQFISYSQKSYKNVFVFDFGGGTLDTALVKIDQESSKILATDGVYIGGDLINADIMREKLWRYFGSHEVWGDYKLPLPSQIFEALDSWFSIPNLNNPNTMQQLERLKYKNSDPQTLERLIYFIKANLGFNLYEAIEKAKKQLSTRDEAIIAFSDGPIEINQKITKKEFEQIISPRVEEISQVVLRTLDKAGLKASEVEVVVRTGGSSLIPVFEEMLVNIFGKEKLQQFETFTSIASGLALYKK